MRRATHAQSNIATGKERGTVGNKVRMSHKVNILLSCLNSFVRYCSVTRDIS